MKKWLSFQYAFEVFFAVLSAGALLAVLYTFLIGKHFIIPSVILTVSVILGNLAFYGFQDRSWAKYLLFWVNLLITVHCFFALFWAKKYREILGDAFEITFGVIVLLFGVLLIQYVRSNRLFK